MLRPILPPLLSLALAATAAAETIKWRDPRAPDSAGNTPLHFAAKELPAAEVAALIAVGVKVNAKNIKGWTPLHAAVRWGTAEKIRLLLDAGAEIDSRTAKGWSPLHHAARHGTATTVRQLLEAGANPNIANHNGWTVLHYAARYGSAETVKLLLNAGADFEAQTGVTGTGYTPLHLAAGNAEAETVKTLIATGTDVDARDRDGWTPLYKASMSEDAEAAETAIRLLLEAGADPDIGNKDKGIVPLHFAVDFASTYPARLLLDAGANPNAADRKGRTPLHDAAYDGTPEMVDLLLDAGADPTLRMRAFGKGTAADEGRRNARLRGTQTLERLIAEASAGPKSMRMPGCEGGWKVARGQTIGDIAEGALGDRKRYREIMALNGLSRQRPHRLNECLKLP